MKKILLLIFYFSCQFNITAQNKNAVASKSISPNLFGLFFEDINYSADGGLYAELVQNRSFEYSPTDNRSWHPFTAWEYYTPAFSYGSLSVETSQPIHPNNPHYAVLTIEHIGVPSTLEKFSKIPENQGIPGVGLKNSGFDNIVIKAGESYNFSMFSRLITENPIAISIFLQNKKGEILAENHLKVESKDWKKYTATLTASASNDSASLVVLATSTGKIALDMISLFPEKTFKNRPNGLRPDLAQALADMKPAFIRFPGGCLAHGDGLGNMYRWKNTVGPVETRIAQKNIWGYHQTAGLGYFEYFQFCEDIGAKPLPVLPAAVSCQNSGGTWRIGGTGQCAVPMAEMGEYIQEVLDLIEWANGPVSSKWGALRAAAGHPESFHLEMVGIGNEDKTSPEFEVRYKMIAEAVKKRHPEITIIGTVGPDSHGEDFEEGWKIANRNNVSIVDEHYYKEPEWFMANLHRYDSYDRTKSKVYLGEYASWGNKVKNAIAEAAFMIGLERNGDVVSLASYAPLFAKKNHTQWRTDMIFFDNSGYFLTPNYHVQKLFSTNMGDTYYENIVSFDTKDSTLTASCVKNNKSGELILKLVNYSQSDKSMNVNLSKFKNLILEADQTILKGADGDETSFENPEKIKPSNTIIKTTKVFAYQAPAMSLSILKFKFKN
ncbi:MAG: alpha-N-arabinofuranosidase [Cytophagaceae bacterium]|nr:alpha-N-arabinofuranosidase [Cytophagaceae bacterium]